MTEAPYVPTDVQVRREAAGFEPWTNAQYDTIQDLCAQLPTNPDYQRLFRNSSEVEQAAVLTDMDFLCPDSRAPGGSSSMGTEGVVGILAGLAVLFIAVAAVARD